MKNVFGIIILAGLLLVGCEKNQSQQVTNYPNPAAGPSNEATTIYNGNIIVGGYYSTFLDSSSIYQWNGSSWSSIKGINGFVRCMVVYNNNLIVGGIFDNAGGVKVNNIAQWNGSKWSSLGTGVSYSYPGTSASPYVRSLAVYNGNLIVGGDFDTVAGIKTSCIAQWNGSSWSAIANGFSSVNALTVYNGNLIACQYRTVEKWDGTKWDSIGYFQDMVTSFAVYNGNLIEGGGYGNGVEQWNGTSWSKIGSFINYLSMIVYNGNLYISASAEQGGGGIFQWNGTSLTQIAIDHYTANPTLYPYVQSFAVYGGNLIALGYYVNGTGNGIGAYNGSTWSAF